MRQNFQAGNGIFPALWIFVKLCSLCERVDIADTLDRKRPHVPIRVAAGGVDEQNLVWLHLPWINRVITLCLDCGQQRRIQGGDGVCVFWVINCHVASPCIGLAVIPPGGGPGNRTTDPVQGLRGHHLAHILLRVVPGPKNQAQIKVKPRIALLPGTPLLYCPLRARPPRFNLLDAIFYFSHRLSPLPLRGTSGCGVIPPGCRRRAAAWMDYEMVLS